jgi:hypothetical protein
VSTVVQPVLDIVETATIVGGAGRLRPPVGKVYTATFLDGTQREIYVELMTDGSLILILSFFEAG